MDVCKSCKLEDEGFSSSAEPADRFTIPSIVSIIPERLTNFDEMCLLRGEA
jgi:hypothetical protein